jgi:hypothetical protein
MGEDGAHPEAQRTIRWPKAKSEVVARADSGSASNLRPTGLGRAPSNGPKALHQARFLNQPSSGFLSRMLLGPVSLVVVVSMVSGAFGTAGSPEKAPTPIGELAQRIVMAAADAIAEAEQSLEAGKGPAEGSQVQCTPTGQGSASCSSASAAMGGSLNSGQPPSPFASFVSPSARYGASSAVASPATGNWAGDLLFGGASSAPIPRVDRSGAPSQPIATVFNETWLLQFTPISAANKWINLTTSSCGMLSVPCPAHRFGAAMGFNQGKHFALMFGGCFLPSNFTEATPGCQNSTILGDTWAWIPLNGSTAGGIWSQVTLQGTLCGGPSEPRCAAGVAPSPRFAGGMTDSARWNASEDMFLFGGCGTRGTYAGNCSLGDTWAFSLGTINKSKVGNGFTVNGSWQQVQINGADCGGPLAPNGTPDPCALDSAPLPRWGFGMGNLDPTSGALLFGGCGSSTTFLSGCSSSSVYGDTWSFSGAWNQVAVLLSGGNYVVCGGPGQLSCGSSAPTPRYYPAFAATGAGDACLFGGTAGIKSGSTVAMADFWGHSTIGSSYWVETPGISAPSYGNWSARFDAVIVPSDDCKSVLLFGGTSPTGGSLGDTEYIPQVFTVDKGYTLWPPSIPPPRFSASMTYWSALTVVVLFGGCGAACPVGDTWLYGKCTTIAASLSNNSSICSPALSSQPIWFRVTYTNLCSTNGCPPARFDASMAFDPTNADCMFYTPNGCVVLFGGIDANGTPLGDTWELMSNSTALVGYSVFWRNCATHCTQSGSPSPRFGAPMAWEPNAPLCDGEWTLPRNSGSHVAAPSCANGTAFESALVLFGGEGSSGVLGDTWLFAGGNWIKFADYLAPTPAARVNSSMAYDQADHYIVLFGGETNSTGGTSGLVNDTWIFGRLFNKSLCGNWASGWCLLNLTGVVPSPRAGLGMTYDAADGILVLYGGVAQSPCDQVQRQCVQTWAFSSGTWTPVLPSSTNCYSTCPPSIYSPSLTYYNISSGARFVLMFGGITPVGTLNVTDAVLGQVFAYCGSPIGGSCGGQGTGGTSYWWEDSYSNPVQVPVPEQSHPMPLEGARMIFDPAISRVVLVGGCFEYGPTGNCVDLITGTWEYYNGSWVSQRYLLTNQSGTCYVQGPPGNPCGAVIDPQVAYDPQIESVVLFGGYSPIIGKSTGQTWVLAPGAKDGNLNYGPITNYINPTVNGSWGTWMNLTPYLPASPSARSDGAMAYDAADGYLLMFGGCSNAPVPFGPCNQTLSDTWTFVASLGNFTWTKVTNSLKTPPSRGGAGLAYVPSPGSVMMVGGFAGPGLVLSDVWSYSAGQWSQEPNAPFLLWDMGMVWDPVDNEVLVASGFGPGNSSCAGQWYSACEDTWTFNGTWHKVYQDPAGSAGFPSAGGEAPLTYDPLGMPAGAVLLLGGCVLAGSGTYAGQGPCQSNTWQFNRASWTDITEWA